MSSNKHNFRKISAKDKQFQSINVQNKLLLDEFEKFLEIESVTNNPNLRISGKARSYRYYLIRLYMLINEKKPEGNGLTMSNSNFVRELEILRQAEGFKEYNEENKHFPSATISGYKRYLNRLILEEDEKMDGISKNLITNDKNVFAEIDGPRGKITITTESFIRSVQVRNNALKDAFYKCEIDDSHSTFISRVTKKQFMETHHLIPMGHQDRFSSNLDVLANVISLCPNCHRKIHHGENDDVRDMINVLFAKRQAKLNYSNLYLEITELLDLYLAE